jgi:hypothetical protein
MQITIIATGFDKKDSDDTDNWDYDFFGKKN